MWQRCRQFTGRSRTSCNFRVSTAVAMLPPQQPLDHINERTVLDLPWGGGGGEPVFVPISVPCRLIPSLYHPLNHSDPVKTEQRAAQTPVNRYIVGIASYLVQIQRCDSEATTRTSPEIWYWESQATLEVPYTISTICVYHGNVNNGMVDLLIIKS